MVELETTFYAWPGGLGGLCALHVRLDLGGLHGAELRAYAGLVREADLLLEAHLRIFCSKRTCGIQSHRLPAPARGANSTCASEAGWRGAKMGLSTPAMMLRSAQSISISPVRSRNPKSSGAPEPPAKSM